MSEEMRWQKAWRNYCLAGELSSLHFAVINFNPLSVSSLQKMCLLRNLWLQCGLLAYVKAPFCITIKAGFGKCWLYIYTNWVQVFLYFLDFLIVTEGQMNRFTTLILCLCTFQARQKNESPNAAGQLGAHCCSCKVLQGEMLTQPFPALFAAARNT